MSGSLISLRRDGPGLHRAARAAREAERPLECPRARARGRALAPELAESGAVVLTGSGRAFSAGADISEFADRDPEAILAYYRTTGGVYEAVAALSQPTFSAIHGYCLGGGLELALATDFRIADRDRGLRLPGGRPGHPPELGRHPPRRAAARRRQGEGADPASRPAVGRRGARARARHRGRGRRRRAGAGRRAGAEGGCVARGRGRGDEERDRRGRRRAARCGRADRAPRLRTARPDGGGAQRPPTTSPAADGGATRRRSRSAGAISTSTATSTTSSS